MKVNRYQNFIKTGLFRDLKPQTHTRKLNPKWGLLGFLGFSGLLGLSPIFRTLQPSQVPFPLFFFCFFGFFGFYFEGKMSNTFMDERYYANSLRASAIACKSALCIIIGVSIFSISILKIESIYTFLTILLSTIGIAFGLSMFLSCYLIYKFENEE